MFTFDVEDPSRQSVEQGGFPRARGPHDSSQGSTGTGPADISQNMFISISRLRGLGWNNHIDVIPLQVDGSDGWKG